MAGVDFSTFRDWCNADPEFAKAVYSAETASIDRLRKRIERASRDPKLWPAAAWLLERRNPKKYGKRDRVDARVTHGLEKFSDEELEARARELAKKYAKEGT